MRRACPRWWSGKGRDDARDGLCRVERVQGGHDEVARLGGEDGRLDGLQVAHFADQDDVGILAERALQAGGEAHAVGTDLALRDHRLLVVVQILDRVLDGDDVPAGGAVDVVDHGRERGRLTATGGAGD
jgi:hypothetical protein